MYANPETVLKAYKDSGIVVSRQAAIKYHYEACHLGKSTELVSRTPNRPAKRPFAEVWIDLIEHKPQTHKGYRWALHMVDSYTTYIWIHFVRHKSDIYSEVKIWIRRMETQSGLKILRVHLDKGTEFAWNSLIGLSRE